MLGDVIVCSLNKIVFRGLRSNGLQGSLDCDEAILFRVSLIGLVHVAGCAIEEGIKSHEERRKLNESPSVLVKVVQVGRRNLDSLEYGDGEIMLNGISSSDLDVVSCYASLIGHENVVTFRSPRGGYILGAYEK